VTALVWANSPWSQSYHDLWATHAGASIGQLSFSKTLLHWINDGLMAIFFFVVGLEIKREILVGELASVRQASLPIIAALGGVIVPALIYIAFNFGGPAAHGWGIPMATDIAFVLGVMALLGDRVPLGVKVFLTALAIVDDIAAVLVIALFYTATISWPFLAAAGATVLVLILANRLGFRHPLVYTLLGIGLWIATLESGVHATIAGVVLAFTVPTRTRLDPTEFLGVSREILNYFENAASPEKGVLSDQEQQAAVQTLEEACDKVQPPLLSMEHALHPWVGFLIMPMFALANAGVTITGDIGATLTDPVALGVIFGLFLGKPIGIFGASWIAVRSGIGALPDSARWAHIHGAAWLGGIGFTMSLFVASLAFGEADHLSVAKIGILTASVLAAIAGSLLLMRPSAAATLKQ
jgi:NhaA family Na+:H+ antiporter